VHAQPGRRDGIAHFGSYIVQYNLHDYLQSE